MYGPATGCSAHCQRHGGTWHGGANTCVAQRRGPLNTVPNLPLSNGAGCTLFKAEASVLEDICNCICSTATSWLADTRLTSLSHGSPRAASVAGAMSDLQACCSAAFGEAPCMGCVAAKTVRFTKAIVRGSRKWVATAGYKCCNNLQADGDGNEGRALPVTIFGRSSRR